MAHFKFTDINNKIIHIVSDNIDNIIMESEGSWSLMSDEEYSEFIKDQMEYTKNNPPPIIEPEPLTAQQKLEAAGLTIEELKDLLGL